MRKTPGIHVMMHAILSADLFILQNTRFYFHMADRSQGNA